jgi:hypothetical protein|tara:strand:- start:873 stop:1094 length:222 start_codon:yes stop_codon:yes gene_type:complete
MENLKNRAAKIGTAVIAATASPLALAQTDYSSLTTAVDWSDVGTSLIAVGAAIIGIFVVMKGVKLVTRMVKGA